MNAKRNAPEQGEGPPVFKNWRRFYTFVAINLIVLIILFYAFTKAFE